MPHSFNKHSKSKKAKKALLSPSVTGTKAGKATKKASLVSQVIAGLAYESIKDRTLTSAQRKGGFRPDVVTSVVARHAIAKGAFRVASNPTKSGFSSGYHESFVVTDMTDVLSRRSKSGVGLSAMPKASSGYWQKHSGKTFPEANVFGLLSAGDGARTDTARTILSGPLGSVAGHSGSGVKSTNQSDAHNLLRDQAMRVLSDPHMTPGTAAVIGAATTLYSMAPGELASKAVGASKLKDQAARSSWEDDRNESKQRLAHAHSQLPPLEQARVMHHMQPLALAIGGPRYLESNRPSSPRRVRHGASGAPIQGGGYDPHAATTGKPKVGISPTADARTITQYVTEPFRVIRQ